VATPIAADRINVVVPDVAAVQAWYEKNFGAKAVKHGSEAVAEIPAGTFCLPRRRRRWFPKGRVFHTIGLELKDLKRFARTWGLQRQLGQADGSGCVHADRPLGNLHRDQPGTRRCQINSAHTADCAKLRSSGCGAAWLARLLGVQEVPSSNLGSPTKTLHRLTEVCNTPDLLLESNLESKKGRQRSSRPPFLGLADSRISTLESSRPLSSCRNPTNPTNRV
jgi:hypothetical protein